MLVSVGGVTLFLLWCIVRVMRSTRGGDKVHGTLDIVPPDVGRDQE